MKVKESVMEAIDESIGTNGREHSGEVPDTGAATEDLRRQARILGDDARRFARTAGEVARSGLQDARDRAGEMVRRTQDRSLQVSGRIADHVREKPLAYLAVAAAGGALLGFLLRRPGPRS